MRNCWSSSPSRARESASSILSTKWILSSERKSSGISSASFLFFAGNITLVRWFLWAAIHFSFIPPTGRTRPYRDISPVIAKSERTLRPVMRDTKATVIVTPAEGPSLGTAAAGKCTCKSKDERIDDNYLSFSRLKLSADSTTATAAECLFCLRGAIPNKIALLLIQLRAVPIDSFITLPSYPVSCTYPFPGYLVVSMSRHLPPISV